MAKCSSREATSTDASASSLTSSREIILYCQQQRHQHRLAAGGYLPDKIHYTYFLPRDVYRNYPPRIVAMSASNVGATVPFVLTYTAPSASAATTATVVGQVLDNGQTNYIPSGTSQAAIYLATASANGASATSIGGSTYYYTTGPAVPDLVTGITVSSSATSSARSSSGGASSSATGTARTTAAGTTSASASASSSTAKSGAGNVKSMGVGSVLVGGLCLSALVMGM